ncbi:MAG: hypothetical protein II839_07245, partial [Kiritimatiellae bacterium]|nr:hypothetical protein [Kiritimatiellia bacterium]
LVATAAAAEAAATGTLHFDADSVGGAAHASASGFKRKRNDGPLWIAAIVLGSLVAIGLLVLFLRGMNA